jgi:hypothetical protein
MDLYFPHIVKVGTVSSTIKILEDKYGNEGYCFWFKILEILAKQENNWLDLSDPQNVGMLVSYMKMDKEKIKQILNTIYRECYQFDETLFKKKVLFIPRLRGSVKKLRGPAKVDANNFLLDDQKKEYADNVFLTLEEYDKLLLHCDSNEAMRKRAIGLLSAYKSQSKENKNRYDSDYAAILNWVITRVKEEFKKSLGTNYPAQHKESRGAHTTQY